MASPTRRTQPSAVTDAEGVIDALVQASFVTMGVLTKIGAEHDLSLTQLRVLAILRDRRPRMSALAEYLGLEKSTMSGLVDRAEKRGLLQRAPHAADRRAVEVSLSAAGATLAAAVHAQVAEALSPMLGVLVPTDRHHLQQLLERMLAPVGADTESASVLQAVQRLQ